MKRTILLAGLVAAAVLTNLGPRSYAATNRLVVTLNDPTGGDPTREVQPDGSIVVRLDLSQPVSGDVSGMFTERSTQRFSPAEEQGLVAITTFWRLETSAGALEGYYFGLRDRGSSGTRDSMQQGLVLTATQAYSAYSQATVTYHLTAASGALRATVTIQPPTTVSNDFLGDVGPSTPPSFAFPIDAAPDADGSTFYFTARDLDGNPGVFKVPAFGGTVSRIASLDPLVAPRGLAPSPVSGVLYVADPRAGDDRSGRIFAIAGAITGANAPAPVPGTEGYGELGLEVMRQDGADLIYFTGHDPRDGVVGVFKIHANQSIPAEVVWKGAPLVQPDSVTVAGNGVVYVSDRAAGGNGLGSVFSINGGTISRIATGFRPGNPAGLAMDQSESWLFVSSLDSQQGLAQILIVNLVTFASGTANKGIGQNLGAGGLHRAHDANLFAWADSSSGGGHGDPFVYHVPVKPPK